MRALRGVRPSSAGGAAQQPNGEGDTSARRVPRVPFYVYIIFPNRGDAAYVTEQFCTHALDGFCWTRPGASRTATGDRRAVPVASHRDLHRDLGSLVTVL